MQRASPSTSTCVLLSVESATSLPRSVAYTDEQEALHKRKIIEDKIEGTQAAAEPSTKSLSS
jgi:hypothetical protein